MKADILKLADQGQLKGIGQSSMVPTISNQQLLKRLSDADGDPLFEVMDKSVENPHAWNGFKTVYQ